MIFCAVWGVEMEEEETLRCQKCFLLLFHSPNYTENHSATRAPKYASLMINNTAFNSCPGSITHIYHPRYPWCNLGIGIVWS